MPNWLGCGPASGSRVALTYLAGAIRIRRATPTTTPRPGAMAAVLPVCNIRQVNLMTHDRFPLSLAYPARIGVSRFEPPCGDSAEYDEDTFEQAPRPEEGRERGGASVAS